MVYRIKCFLKSIYTPTVFFSLSIADVKFSTFCKMASDVDLLDRKPYWFSFIQGAVFNEIVCSDIKKSFSNILENCGSNDNGV